MLNRMKDRTTSTVIKTAVNAFLKEYGKIMSLNLDSAEKSVTIKMLLDGEETPIDIRVGRYELLQEGEKHLIMMEEIRTTRPWMDTFAKNYVEGKKFKIPRKYVKMIKMVV